MTKAISYTRVQFNIACSTLLGNAYHSFRSNQWTPHQFCKEISDRYFIGKLNSEDSDSLACVRWVANNLWIEGVHALTGPDDLVANGEVSVTGPAKDASAALEAKLDGMRRFITDCLEEDTIKSDILDFNGFSEFTEWLHQFVDKDDAVDGDDSPSYLHQVYEGMVASALMHRAVE